MQLSLKSIANSAAIGEHQVYVRNTFIDFPEAGPVLIRAISDQLHQRSYSSSAKCISHSGPNLAEVSSTDDCCCDEHACNGLLAAGFSSPCNSPTNHMYDAKDASRERLHHHFGEICRAIVPNVGDMKSWWYYDDDETRRMKQESAEYEGAMDKCKLEPLTDDAIHFNEALEPEPEPRLQQQHNCNSTENSPRGPSSVAQRRKLRGPQKRDMMLGRLSKRLLVGIEDDRDFHVVKRLLGPGGMKLKRIVELAGRNVRVSVKGRGAVLNEEEAGTDALALLITSQGLEAQQGLEYAIALAEKLIQEVHREYEEFCSAKDAPVAAGPGYSSHPGTSCKRVPMPLQPATSEDGWISCRFPVGIAEDREFRVVSRLLGRKGENVERIAAEARSAANKASSSFDRESGKTIVSIRGHGARRSYASKFDGDSQAEEGPLEIVVAAASQSAFDRAAEAVHELLANVHQQYRQDCKERGRCAPDLVIYREAARRLPK
jgi:hypothetical protein